VLAEKWLEIHEIKESSYRTAFLIGTLYPDVHRVAGKLSRSDTHKRDVKLSQIASAPPFLAGQLLHCYADQRHGELIESWGVLERAGGNVNLLKFAEDELLYTAYKRRPLHLLFYFEPGELDGGVTHCELLQWHLLVASYLEQPPSRCLLLPHRSRITRLSKKRWMRDYVNRMCNQFEDEWRCAKE